MFLTRFNFRKDTDTIHIPAVNIIEVFSGIKVTLEAPCLKTVTKVTDGKQPCCFHGLRFPHLILQPAQLWTRCQKCGKYETIVAQQAPWKYKVRVCDNFSRSRIEESVSLTRGQGARNATDDHQTSSCNLEDIKSKRKSSIHNHVDGRNHHQVEWCVQRSSKMMSLPILGFYYKENAMMTLIKFN